MLNANGACSASHSLVGLSQTCLQPMHAALPLAPAPQPLPTAQPPHGLEGGKELQPTLCSSPVLACRPDIMKRLLFSAVLQSKGNRTPSTAPSLPQPAPLCSSRDGAEGEMLSAAVSCILPRSIMYVLSGPYSAEPGPPPSEITICHSSIAHETQQHLTSL